jgi:hypothetical protein
MDFGVLESDMPWEIGGTVHYTQMVMASNYDEMPFPIRSLWWIESISLFDE